MSAEPFIPEVKFLPADLETEAGLMYKFSIPGKSPWLDVFYRVYPRLKEIHQNAKSEEEARLECRALTERTIKNNHEAIVRAQDSIQKDWDTVGSEFLKTLAEHFETAWPVDKTQIVGYVSILSVNPRFLDSYSFCVNYLNLKSARETIAHEIVHFLWFKKWKEVFPEMARDTYERPHLVWRLSEVMDPIILQCDPKIKELIKPEKWGYKSFEGLKIGETSMTEHFSRIYRDCLEKKTSFEDTLKILWKEAQEHRQVLEGF